MVLLCVCVREMAKFSIYTIGNGKLTSFELEDRKVFGVWLMQMPEFWMTFNVYHDCNHQILLFTYSSWNIAAAKFTSKRVRFSLVLFYLTNERVGWNIVCVCCEKSPGKRTTQKPYTHSQMKNANSRIRTVNFLENCVYFNVFLVDCWWALNPRSQRVVVLK